MHFTPFSDDELDSQMLIQPGTYQFQVLQAEDCISKNGNEQIKLNLKVWDGEGKEHVIFDYILAAFPRKLKGFCKSANILDKYETGFINALDCLDKGGLLKIGIEKGKPYVDKNGFQAQGKDKNYVMDYLQGEVGEKVVVAKDNKFDDDLPF